MVTIRTSDLDVLKVVLKPLGLEGAIEYKNNIVNKL